MDPRRMRLALCILALLAVTPLATAQAPDAVGIVCGALQQAPDVRDAVPVCPGEPAAPAAPGAPHQHAPDAPQDAPAAAQDLAERATEDAQGIAADPRSAPSRLASLVAAIVRFVEELLDLPAAGAAAVGNAAKDATDAVRDGMRTAADAVMGLFERDAPVKASSKGTVPKAAPRLDDLGLQLPELPSPIAR